MENKPKIDDEEAVLQDIDVEASEPEPVAVVSEPKKEPKKSPLKKVLVTALVVVLMGASAAGAYFWRDKVANDLVKQKDANILTLQADKTNLTKEGEQKDSNIASLQTLNETMTAQQKQKDDYIAILEDDNATLAEQEAAATANDETWRNFSSAEFGFNIQFPGIPYKSTFDFTMNGQTEEMTYFSRSNMDGYYELETAVYSDAFMESLPSGDGRLFVAMDNAVGYDEGVTVTSNELITFNGQRALKESLSIDYGDGQPVKKYGLVFFKGNELFVIDTYYTTLDDFNKFVGSFSFK
ncbi:MAG: hypothetical protein WA087_04065 [Candidatus Saccharimonadales bacterium]